jgi:hypothetical protein
VLDLEVKRVFVCGGNIMGLKRKPPKGNVRRVVCIENNLPGIIVSKTGEIVQVESFEERILTLLFERDSSVLRYRSQPITFTFQDEKELWHKYTPDFLVWRQNGKIEIHEVTLIKRREISRIRERERAAQKICEAHQWRYVVHTEQSLPQQTEVTNLQALFPYRLKAYANGHVIAAISEYLLGLQTPTSLFGVMKQVAHSLSIPEPIVFGTLCHLLWQETIATDLQILLIDECMFTPEALIWLPRRKVIEA